MYNHQAYWAGRAWGGLLGHLRRALGRPAPVRGLAARPLGHLRRCHALLGRSRPLVPPPGPLTA